MYLQGPLPAVTLTIDSGDATLRHGDHVMRSWPVTNVEALSTEQARNLADSGSLLFIERAAPAALAILREHGTAYVTRTGEWHLVEPPGLLVIRPADGKPALVPNPERPLGSGAARLARWLLLHPAEQPTITGLAQAAKVSEATSSRAVRQLADRALLSVTVADDARRRTVALTDASALLDTLADESAWRRARRATWDIGAADMEEALAKVRRAATTEPLPYALGELAGAAQIERLVEPAVVTLWISDADLTAWQNALLALPARPAAGRVTVRVAPDPAVLDWGQIIDGLRVADPVQLYIDCRHAGERAIDTAQAMRKLVLSR